jgi:hypothetical protein
MSASNLISSGAVLLSVVAIAYGGTFLLRVTTGRVPTNDLQRRFFRAGHAHAGVLVILSVTGRDPKEPNGWRALIWIGGTSLTIGLIAAGIGLIHAGLAET